MTEEVGRSISVDDSATGQEPGTRRALGGVGRRERGKKKITKASAAEALQLVVCAGFGEGKLR